MCSEDDQQGTLSDDDQQGMLSDDDQQGMLSDERMLSDNEENHMQLGLTD